MPHPKNVLARVESKAGAPAITVSVGANHYRIIGLEVTRTAGTGIAYALIRFKNWTDHVIIDRSWIHGTPLDETMRGINLGGASYVGIVDSYFSDFHCIAKTGACTDAQAILGGNSHVPVGVYKIVNNYLEAAAENVMFGGARGSQIPSDIEIRRNYMFKPISWLPGRPNFVGKNFIVKNLFELKNAERVLVESNLMENSWGGYSRVGIRYSLDAARDLGRCPRRYDSKKPNSPHWFGYAIGRSKFRRHGFPRRPAMEHS